MIQINMYLIFMAIFSLNFVRNGVVGREMRDVILNQPKCEYEHIYLTQYETAVVVWRGNKFDVWCQKAFIGQNSKNVATDYTVCFRVLDYKIRNCDIKIEYISLFKRGVSFSSAVHTFSCRDQMRDWCTDEPRSAVLKITAPMTSQSYLRLEVEVKAGTNLSIAECAGIVVGVFIFLVIAFIICCRKCRKNREQYSHAIRTEENARGTTHVQPRLQMHDITGEQSRHPPPSAPMYPVAPTVDYSAPPPSYSECVRSGLVEGTSENNAL